MGDLGDVRYLAYHGRNARRIGAEWMGLLTAPFWLAFILWPIFYVWRRLHDRPLWAEEVVLLLHDPESKEPFGLEIMQGRTGIKVAVEEVCQLDGVAPLLKDISKQLPDPKVGIPFETYDAKDLVQWGQLKVAVEEVCQLDGVAPLLKDISKQLPDPKVGIPFETYDAKDLVQWGQHWLQQSHSEEGDVLKFVRWTDTLKYEVQKITR